MQIINHVTRPDEFRPCKHWGELRNTLRVGIETSAEVEVTLAFCRVIVLCACFLWSEIVFRSSWLSVARNHHSRFAMVKTWLDKKLQVDAMGQDVWAGVSSKIGYRLPRCLIFLIQGSFFVRRLRATVAFIHGLWRTSCVEGFTFDASDVAYPTACPFQTNLVSTSTLWLPGHSFFLRPVLCGQSMLSCGDIAAPVSRCSCSTFK